MPCLVAIIAYLMPRLVIAVLALATDYMSRAYSTLLWPLLGFIFMPYTTLAYAFAKNAHGSVDGIYLVIVIVAVLLDLGTHGSAKGARRSRKKKD